MLMMILYLLLIRIIGRIWRRRNGLKERKGRERERRERKRRKRRKRGRSLSWVSRGVVI